MSLSPPQAEKLAWLHRQGGSGHIDRHGRVVAGGEHMPQGCWKAWLNLVALGMVAGDEGRITITKKGARYVSNE